MTNRHQANDLKQLQSLPLEAKIRMSEERIRVWYESWVRFKIEDLDTGKFRYETFDMRDRLEPPLKDNEFSIEASSGSVYVSFSGGKDSTILADLCAKVCERYGWTLYLFFANTGLEYPEIQKFVKTFAEWLRKKYEIEVVLDVVRPEMRFDQVIKKYGYPVISKETAITIKEARAAIEQDNQNSTAWKKLKGELIDPEGEKSQYNAEKWAFMLDAPYKISHQCCDVMKKRPAKKYTKETGRMPILATMAHESRLRHQKWLKFGCNAFEQTNPVSQPLSFWTEQDVLHYIKKFNVPYCSVYGDINIKPHGEDVADGQIDLIDFLGCYGPEDTLATTGCVRTGCIFCMFGCHLDKEPNRFQRLKETHPKQYRYCINGGEMVDGKWQPNKDGLGLGKVLDYIGVKYD